MKLPIPFVGPKKEKTAYYLALLLTEEKANAVILEEVAGKVKIISSNDAYFPISIEQISLEDLIEAIDSTISKAEEVLPPHIETHKTVFGVKENWIEAETKKIKKEYLQKLKKVCDALDLSPLGFMVVSEAIAHLMQEDEGAPLSAILAELGKKTVTLTLFRGGKIVQTVEGKIEHSAAITVDTLLKHFTIEVLPARLILYDAKLSQDIAQRFISHQWSKSLPFLHLPQISVLPDGFDGRAVTFGAASQMGFDVLDEPNPADIKTFDGNTEETKDIHHKQLQVTEEKGPDNATDLPTENFGFLIDRDIAESGILPDQKTQEEIPITEPIPHTHYKHPFAIHTPQDHEDDSDNEELPVKLSTETESGPKSDGGKKSFSMTSVLGAFRMPKLPILNTMSFGMNKLLIGIIAFIVILGSIAGGIYYFYFYKVSATVTLTVKPKITEQKQDIVFSSDSHTDFANHILAAQTITATSDGELSTGTTGKKAVGDKAKGTVTLYNSSTNSDSHVNTGTTITSANNLDYTLDKDVTVASASGDIFSGTKPGTADVSVTASDIGTDYNLPSGTKFTVNGSSTLAGKNDNAFSGGTKKTVTIVAKDDLAKLKTDLIKNLQDKANDQLKQQAGGDTSVLPVVLAVATGKTTYDKSAGDEAKTVKLTASVNFTGLAYHNSDLVNFAKIVLKNSSSADVVYQDSSIKTSLDNMNKKSGTEISASLDVSAGQLPKIDTNMIAQELSGKSFQNMQTILNGISQLDKSDISYSPTALFLPKLFSRLPNRVSIKVLANE